MEKEAKPLPFEDFLTNAPSIFEGIEKDGRPVRVKRGKTVFAIVPEKRARRSRGILAPNDSLFDIIGIGESTGPTDTSSNKHKYLADAYSDLHKP